jgi:hypothetical protein
MGMPKGVKSKMNEPTFEPIQEAITQQQPTYQLPVIMDSHGRILIPASIRRVMQISPLSNLVIKVTGNQLTIDTI